ncbi:hypothetical protein LUW74_25470 [Actinomadura madurae]|uniref:hypothetical protein n=1 Tax=Actinomadura madurae TaxID=1993 RepID=UPI00202709B1|nr:hypothetical protein [Actinomadura madurae]URN06340.1 hypothetical protein LUW74_25470 [Actinomadura madurae]
MRSPDPIASRTRREMSGFGNSASRDASGTLNSAAAGSAHSALRKSSAGVPWGHVRTMPGRPPDTRCASTAPAASSPRASPVSAGFSGPRTRVSARP